MKKILLIILLCLNIQLTYGIDYSTCGNRHGGYNSVPTEQTYRRIGYTTQYGGGFSNTKSTYYYPSNSWHNTHPNFSKPIYYNYHYNTIYPGNTYDNYQSNHNSRGSGPRRVIIRSDGDSIDTGRQDDYDPDWKYYHGVLWEDGIMMMVISFGSGMEVIGWKPGVLSNGFLNRQMLLLLLQSATD